jgi:hypothetical protein
MSITPAVSASVDRHRDAISLPTLVVFSDILKRQLDTAQLRFSQDSSINYIPHTLDKIGRVSLGEHAATLAFFNIYR